DFVAPYALWIPLLSLLGWWAVEMARAFRRRAKPTLTLLSAPVAAALVHALYIVGVGGDFMHGRLLLPFRFSAKAPLSIVALPLPNAEVGKLQATFGLSYGAVPFLALLLSWWAVRDGSPHLLLWPALGIGGIMLPGIYFLVAEAN